MKRLLNSISVFTLAISVLSLFGASTSVASPLQILKTFDGQVATCLQARDANRLGYRLMGSTGVIREGNVEIKIDVETMRCSPDATGLLGFRAEGMGGRHVNANGGFIEFTTLEVVGYTPDLRVVRAQPVDMSVGVHSVTLTAPVKEFAGLFVRNSVALNDRRIMMNIVLRGQASLGDAATGKVMERSNVPFGAYNVSLSEREGTLTFAPPATTPASRPMRVSSVN